VKINEGYEEGVAHFARLLGTPGLTPNPEATVAYELAASSER